MGMFDGLDSAFNFGKGLQEQSALQRGLQDTFDKQNFTSLKTEAEELVGAAAPILSFEDRFNEITTKSSTFYNLPNPQSGYVWIKFPSEAAMNKIEEAKSNVSTILSTVGISTDLIETRPEHFRSFNFKRFTQGIGTFDIVLYDRNWQEIETSLVRAKGMLFFKYGYSSNIGANDKYNSPWIAGKVFTYSLDFNLEGVTIVLTGIAMGHHELATDVEWKVPDKTPIKISSIVKDIGKKFGITKFVIEETGDVETTTDAMETLKKIPINIAKVGGSTSLEYIVRQLIPISRNGKGEGGYTFFLEQRDKDIYLHFHTLTYIAENYQTGFKLPTFTIYKNKLSPVKSFKPNWNISMAQIAGGTKTFSPIYDLTNQSIQEIFTTQEEIPSKDKGTENTMKEPKLPSLSDSTHISANPAACWPSQPDAVKAATQNDVSRKTQTAITATLSVVGTPKFGITDPIGVLVYMPRALIGTGSVDANSKMHWISGMYRIIGIVDSIQNGEYTTTLTLATSGRNILLPDKRTATESAQLKALPTSVPTSQIPSTTFVTGTPGR